MEASQTARKIVNKRRQNFFATDSEVEWQDMKELKKTRKDETFIYKLNVEGFEGMEKETHSKQKGDDKIVDGNTKKVRQTGDKQVTKVGQPRAVVRAALDASVELTCDGEGQSMRFNQRNICVIDDFICDHNRKSLLEWMLERRNENDDHGRDNSEPPSVNIGGRWERMTRDNAQQDSLTWGLTSQSLKELFDTPNQAVLDIQMRLKKLFPEYRLVHMPSTEHSKTQLDDWNDAQHVALPFVGNAVTHGDIYSYHVDADSTGRLPNGKAYSQRTADEEPFLFSLILYLNNEWDRDWGGETLFLDRNNDTGIFVSPKPCRAVLMDADVFHKINPICATAKTPRFSLVWKVVALPKTNETSSPKRLASVAKYGVCAANIIDEHNREEIVKTEGNISNPEIIPFGSVHNVICIGKRQLRKEASERRTSMQAGE